MDKYVVGFAINWVAKPVPNVLSRPGPIMLSICLLYFWAMLQLFPIMLQLCPIMLYKDVQWQLLLNNKLSLLSSTCNSVSLDSLLSESEDIISLYYIHLSLILWLINNEFHN